MELVYTIVSSFSVDEIHISKFLPKLARPAKRCIENL